MFIREATSDGKISYWTIRPESNRCITLDQVCKVSSCGSVGASMAAESRTAELRLLVLRAFFTSFKNIFLHLLQTDADPAALPVSVQMLLLSQQVGFVFLSVLVEGQSSPVRSGGRKQDLRGEKQSGCFWSLGSFGPISSAAARRENICLAGGRDTSSRDTEDKQPRLGFGTDLLYFSVPDVPTLMRHVCPKSDLRI